MENRTAKSQKKKEQDSGITVKRVLLGMFLLVVVMLAGIGCGFLTASLNTKSDITEDILPPASSHIYDINGNEIANVHATENRVPVKLAQIPKELQNAFIAVEDNRFYEHMGVDPRGILRAAWANLSDREIAEGGSTITQQLAKNAYLTQDRTMKRKIQEVFLALQLERQYTKQEILELYLNQIYFGQGAYGVQAAAQTYFGKNVEELNLNECAMLAGLPKSPNYYDPFNNLKAAQERKRTVLDQMAKYHYISGNLAAQTAAEEVTLVKSAQQKEKALASYFIDYVTQLMINKYGADAVYKEGLKIYTTLDTDMQRAAENALEHLPDYAADGNGIMQPQCALVAIDPHNGHVKAMVGGRGTDQFNRATLAERQPGSAFKPFVFAAALENGFSPNTVIVDSPITIGDWSPQNSSKHFSGRVTLRTVATFSMNVPTVKIAKSLGIDKPIYYAQEMGITSFVLEGPTNDRNLASSLGGLTKGVTPLELTSAYGTFANKGVHVDPVVVVRVLDRNGKILEEAAPSQRSVISETSAAELTSMLQDVVVKGTGTRAAIGRPAAGKTGTTSDYRDAWFVGYTPDLVTGVWIGNDSNESLRNMYGGEEPAIIWRAFMEVAEANMPVRDFEFNTSEKKEKQVTELKEDGSTSTGRASRSESSAAAPAPKKESPAEEKNSRESASAPASEPVRQPEPAVERPSAAPASEPEPSRPAAPPPGDIPTPGAGASKGKN